MLKNSSGSQILYTSKWYNGILPLWYSSIIVNNDKIIVSGTSEISLPCDYEFVKELKNSTKEKQIEISDLTDEELDEMIELYKKQIQYKKDKLKKYKNNIN